MSNKTVRLILFLLIMSSFSGCAPVKYVTEETQKNLSVGDEVQVQVMAAGDWRNSGVMVKKGEKYKITASGKWHFGGLANFCGPDGIGCDHILAWDLGGIVPGFKVATLIAKIGEEGRPFGVGASFQLESHTDGYLFFRMNDPVPGDNIGAVNVNIAKISGIDSIAASSEDVGRAILDDKVRQRIAVLSLKPTTKAAAEEGYGDTVSEMLITGLIKTGRYEVLERSQIKQILNERQFSETDVVAGESAMNVGRMLKVKYLVIGSVARIQNLTEVDVRFVDTETGKALLAENVSCQSLGDLRNAINRLVNKISTGYPGRL
jgi:TolB-like protein